LHGSGKGELERSDGDGTGHEADISKPAHLATAKADERMSGWCC
jgi:hypothetical protein